MKNRIIVSSIRDSNISWFDLLCAIVIILFSLCFITSSTYVKTLAIFAGTAPLGLKLILLPYFILNGEGIVKKRAFFTVQKLPWERVSFMGLFTETNGATSTFILAVPQSEILRFYFWHTKQSAKKSDAATLKQAIHLYLSSNIGKHNDRIIITHTKQSKFRMLPNYCDVQIIGTTGSESTPCPSK